MILVFLAASTQVRCSPPAHPHPLLPPYLLPEQGNKAACLPLVPCILSCLEAHPACVELVEGAMGALGNIAALDANRPTLVRVIGKGPT